MDALFLHVAISKELPVRVSTCPCELASFVDCVHTCISVAKPNAFVSIRVPSQHIRDEIIACQEAMVEVEPALASTMVSLEKLHLTLMVMRLETEEQVER